MLRAWLNDMMEYTSLHFPGDERTQIQFASRMLDEVGKKAVQAYRDKILFEEHPPSMLEWGEELRKALHPRDPAYQAHLDYTKARQGPEENCYEYFGRLTELVDCINTAFPETPIPAITEEAFSRHYVDTLRDRLQRRVHQHVVASVRIKRGLPESACEWMHLACEIEDEVRSEDEQFRLLNPPRRFNRNRAELEEGMPLHLKRHPKRKVGEEAKASPSALPRVAVVHQSLPRRKGKKGKRLRPGRERARACFLCHEIGHVVADCPKNEVTPGRPLLPPRN